MLPQRRRQNVKLVIPDYRIRIILISPHLVVEKIIQPGILSDFFTGFFIIGRVTGQISFMPKHRFLFELIEDLLDRSQEVVLSRRKLP